MSAHTPPAVKQIELRRRDPEIAIAVFRTIFILIVLFSPQFAVARGTSGRLLDGIVIAAALYNLVLFLAHVRGIGFPRSLIVLFDTVLVTAWIRLCGADCSSFFALYYAVVIVAGLWFGIGGATLSALLASGLYTWAALSATAPDDPNRITTCTLVLQIILLLVTAGVISVVGEIQKRERESLAMSRSALHQHMQRIRIAQRIDDLVRPKRLASVPGFDIAFRFRPSVQAAAGDYYDVIRLGDRQIGICVGDILAKMELAVPYLPVFKAEFRAAARREQSPAAVLNEINRWVAVEIEEHKDQDAFVSMCYLVADLDEGSLTYAIAGHDPPLLISGSGAETPILGQDGIVLGVLEEVTYREDTVPLHQGDALVLFTDGITEVTDARKQFLGREGLLRYAVDNLHLPTSKAMVDATFESVNEFGKRGRRQDDMTLLVVRVTASEVGRLDP